MHARSVVAGVLDGASGVLSVRRVPPRSEEAVEWLQSLPRPVRVAYEAGPTGYGLARALPPRSRAMAAPSKIPRAPCDRVKTDQRDVERLARLLGLGELVAVRVPEPHEEAARDWSCPRGCTRRSDASPSPALEADLRHDASAWTLAHDAWLRRQRFPARPLSLAFEECYGAMLHAKAGRHTLDRAIGELAAAPPFAEVVSRRR